MATAKNEKKLTNHRLNAIKKRLGFAIISKKDVAALIDEIERLNEFQKELIAQLRDCRLQKLEMAKEKVEQRSPTHSPEELRRAFALNRIALFRDHLSAAFVETHNQTESLIKFLNEFLINWTAENEKGGDRLE